MTGPGLNRQDRSRELGRHARTAPARFVRITRSSAPTHWRRRLWPVGLALLLLMPYPVMALVDGPLGERMTAAGNFSLVMTDMIMIAGAALLTFDARLGNQPGSGCLGAALIFLALQDLPVALLASYDSRLGDHLYELSPMHALIALVGLALLAVASGRFGVPSLDPLWTAALLGVAVSVSHLLLIVSGREGMTTVSTVTGALLLTVVGAMFVLTAMLLLRGTLLPAWASRRLVVALVVYAVARFAPGLVGATSPRWWSVVLVVLSGVTILGVAGRLLRQTNLENEKLTQSYARLAETARADLEHDREVGHEVSSIVAGIVAASNLLTERQHSDLDPRALQDMITAESARLHRISTDRTLEPVSPLALDNVLAPLVVAQSALGHPVSWRPTGVVVLGRRDALSEVFNILLTNAARHAPGAVTSVTVRPVGPRTQIRVTDQGPGVPSEIAGAIFDWGVRGPASPGQGIGLPLARRLTHCAGGTIALERTGRTDGRGATFIVTLPSVSPAHRRTDPHAGGRPVDVEAPG